VFTRFSNSVTKKLNSDTDQPVYVLKLSFKATCRQMNVTMCHGIEFLLKYLVGTIISSI